MIYVSIGKIMKNELDDKLLQLRDDYNRRLPEKIATLENQWETLHHQYDPELFKAFHRGIHSLSGSAGLYGKAELSQICHILSDYLKHISDQFTSEQIQYISNALQKIKRTLA